MSVAPIDSSLSMTEATLLFSTSAETDTQSVRSRFITDGERLPGVTRLAWTRQVRR